MPTDLEIAREGVMRELEVERQHKKIYTDSKVEAMAKIGANKKMKEEEVDERPTSVGNYNPFLQKYEDIEEPGVEKVEEVKPSGIVINAEKPDLGLKKKEDQAETWIASGTEPGGGHWEKAGYPDEEGAD
jgi:hypothetical protein